MFSTKITVVALNVPVQRRDHPLQDLKCIGCSQPTVRASPLINLARPLSYQAMKRGQQAASNRAAGGTLRSPGPRVWGWRRHRPISLSRPRKVQMEATQDGPARSPFAVGISLCPRPMRRPRPTRVHQLNYVSTDEYIEPSALKRVGLSRKEGRSRTNWS